MHAHRTYFSKCSWTFFFYFCPNSHTGTDNNKRYEFSAVARSSIFSSKSERTGEDEGLSSTVYKDTLQHVYQLPSQKNITVDIVLASPSLEVGIDLPNLTESVMVNACHAVDAASA